MFRVSCSVFLAAAASGPFSAASATDPGSGAAPDLIANHFSYASPGGLETTRVDVAYAAEVEQYGMSWVRTTGSSKELVCFSSANPTGAPMSEALVLDSVQGPDQLTAGPVVTDIGHGTEMLVAWAVWVRRGGANHTERRVARLSPGGGRSWDLLALHRAAAGPDLIVSLDLGESEWSRATLVGGVASGRLFTETYSILGGEDNGGFSFRWLRRFGESDGNPSIARSNNRLIAFESYDHSGLKQISAHNDRGGLVQVFPTYYGVLSHPQAAGSGAQLGIVARSRGEDALRIHARAYDAGYGRGWQNPVVIAEFDRTLEFEGPALGQTGTGSFAVAWKAGFDDGWILQGMGCEPLRMQPCEGIYEIAEDFYSVPPVVSDNFGTQGGSAFVVWGGFCDWCGSQETRAALIGGCE